MTTQFATKRPEHRGLTAPRPTPARTGGLAEAVFALATIVLAIIGLAGAAPRYVDPVAIIVLGATFLFERWTLTAERPASERDRSLWAESAAGWTGVVLGILVLLGLTPTVLAPIAIIVFGVGLALSPGLASHLGRVLVGVGAAVLGILALLRLDPRTFALISLIGVAAMLLLTGPAVASLIHRPLHRHAAV